MDYQQEPWTPVEVPETLEQKQERLLSQYKVMTDDENDQWIHANVVIPHLKSANIERRFWNEITEWTEPAQRKVFERCLSMIDGRGAIIALVGKRGAGKTTIAAQILIKMIRAWYAWGLTPRAFRSGKPPVGLGRYEKVLTAVGKLKPLYSEFGSTGVEEIMQYRESICEDALLVLDEKHDAAELKVTGRILTDILDRRYAKKKDSIIISNEDQKDFEATAGDSVLSRISEHGMIIPCNWKSFRMQSNP